MTEEQQKKAIILLKRSLDDWRIANATFATIKYYTFPVIEYKLAEFLNELENGFLLK